MLTSTSSTSYFVSKWYPRCLQTFHQQTANSKQQTANSKQQTANSKQQTANSKQQTANSKQQTATATSLLANSIFTTPCVKMIRILRRTVVQ
jgi:hypothetical protein